MSDSDKAPVSGDKRATFSLISRPSPVSETLGHSSKAKRGQNRVDRAAGYSFRAPTAEDGAEIYELVKETGVLDLNSPYKYVLFGEHFGDSSIVAERDGKVRGFVTGFRPPNKPDSLFVWQIGVANSDRGRGLGSVLLQELLERESCEGVRYLEATVTPSNKPSSSLFRRFATKIGVKCRVSDAFASDLFPGDDHEREDLFRIGPLPENLTQETSDTMEIFEKYESVVRSYCRDFPKVFSRAKGYKLWTEDGKEYIDFFAGAGALNYGHNDDRMKEKIIEYLSADGIAHSLDMATEAKGLFLERFNEVILEPRDMEYKTMFPGPTGTNTVEAALKIARKVTGRDRVVGFTNGFHGMTLGALSVTGNGFKRKGAGTPLNGAVSMPYDGYLGDNIDSLDVMSKMLDDGGSGFDKPAAVIVETVQGEGGINVARFEWLKELETLCRKHDILLIIDDVQAGCGRTGTFFSFEPAGIQPDIICLSKSIGGYGLPLALTLVKPEYDIFAAGEHNGTFRGNNLAFVAAAEALRFWENDEFERSVKRKADLIRSLLEGLATRFPELDAQVRGRGFMQGLAMGIDDVAGDICHAAFDKGLVIETAGSKSEVVKILAPLTIDDAGLEKGFAILEKAIEEVLEKRKGADAGKNAA